jgi:hypothetical protein
MMTRKSLTIALAAGTCLSAAGLAQAQTQLINMSGATLLQNFAAAPGATNDFIDADKNLVAGSLGSAVPQQLAAPGTSSASVLGGVWALQYRVVGSVNGFNELARFGHPNFVTTGHSDPNGILGAAQPGSTFTRGVLNRTNYANNGAYTGTLFDINNPGGAPFRATSATNRTPVAGSQAAGTGITIDVAIIDVSSFYATQKPGGSAAPALKPSEAGYGTNPRVSLSKTGTLTTGATAALTGGFSNALPGLSGRNLFDPANAAAANSQTIFDTTILFAPIAPVVNPGTQLYSVTMSELRHLFGTGRSVTGENLLVSTRDVGSGTRNGFQNSIGQAPDFGIGDNIGGESSQAGDSIVGANFTPTNKASNDAMESTLRNARLGIGYGGPERGLGGGSFQSWLVQNALEIPSVTNDIYGGTLPQRPNISSVVNNSTANSWLIGAQSVLATIGDPRAEPVADGGDANGRPTMANKAAAAFVNNISRSVEAFVAVPGGANTNFMPAEQLATQFVLVSALDRIRSNTDPLNLIANPSFSAAVKNWTTGSTAGIPNSVLNNARLDTVNTASNGRVPFRAIGTTYNDGVVNGLNYVNQGGAAVTYGNPNTNRNRVAYDFNGDGVRTLTDASDMVAAYRQRVLAGPVWTAPAGSGPIAGAPGSDAVIEILGDGNMDGNFDAADLRYWADGLAISGGGVDRKAGFTALDTAFSGNLFGTTLATIKPYAAGDSRGDVANPGRNATGTGLDRFRAARGWAPIGADGAIDTNDIDYVIANLVAANNGVALPNLNPSVSATWSNLAEAVKVDFSADINGDRVISSADLRELCVTILGVGVGDLNFDGKVNNGDRALITANTGTTPATYSRGDVNGDGVINAADGVTLCIGDFSRDGQLNIDDIFIFLNTWFGSPNARADISNDNVTNIDDIFIYLNIWFGGCQ